MLRKMTSSWLLINSKKTFKFFNLSFHQQIAIPKATLKNGDPIFDVMSINEVNLLSSCIQTSSMLDKSAPIPLNSDQLPPSVTFEQYMPPSSEILHSTNLQIPLSQPLFLL
ncbi:unnamed protein product [Ambrosiozyma monospora]|uniref:Unnamed protein product n=1 Tax=Ambrosiozyma monospora TaxID=43982 RepID=A0ACB5SSV6_AMBMO|nr:unnamed protein product [Ambrosiozyma monospora]